MERLFLWVIFKAINGSFSTGDILLFSSTIIIAGQTIITMIQESTLLYDTLLYMEKFFSFMDIPSSLVSGNKKINSEGIQKIEFKNVSFTYPGASSATLNNISFSILPKEKIALVGENGSGKSTIIKLICRLYDIDNGSILVNGSDIKEYDIDEYRKEIGIIFQDYSKYDLTVKENIAVSDVEKISDAERINDAASKSGIDKIILPYENKYEQQLGKNFKDGVELSGGQWQKLAISRAFFRYSSLLLFDEPSSSLDAKSEEYFFDRINEMSEDKMVIFITHKLSAATISDKIIVLKDGHIEEEGSHNELIMKNGHYAQLYTIQAKRFTNTKEIALEE